MIKLRPYTDADYEAVKRLRQAADMFEEIWDSRDSLASMVERDPSAILVATLDDQVVGSVVLLTFSCYNGRIFRLVVDRAERGQGIGSQLLDAAIEVFKGRGIIEVGLYMEEAKTELKDYYDKRGFRPDPATYLFMSKKL